MDTCGQSCYRADIMPGGFDGAGVRALTFGVGYFRDPRQDGAFRWLGPLELPDLHRRPDDLADASIEPEEVQRLVRLVATWDAAVARDERLSRFARLEPNGRVIVWPDDAPHVFFAGPGDPAAMLPRFAMGAVLASVRDGLQRWCTLDFADGGGFELVPGSLLGVAYAAFALELSAGERRGPVCAICGTPLEGERISKRYCTDRCKARARRLREKAARLAAADDEHRLSRAQLARIAGQPTPEILHPEDFIDA